MGLRIKKIVAMICSHIYLTKFNKWQTVNRKFNHFFGIEILPFIVSFSNLSRFNNVIFIEVL